MSAEVFTGIHDLQSLRLVLLTVVLGYCVYYYVQRRREYLVCHTMPPSVLITEL